jgi:hypothetical protein
LLTAGASPIDAVKALHRIEGDLGRAKEVVHRNLAATQQANAERLWDAAERALSDE